MSLSIASLNSGSNGNCYYIGNATDAILVDAGISCRETEKRMQRLGLSMQLVKAIFISHEHSDHIKGLCTLAKKYNLPVYISPGTLLNCPFNLDPVLIRNLNVNVPVIIGSLTVQAFNKIHDAFDPHSFMITCNDIKIGVFTDLGEVCESLKFYFSQCHAAFLEANYDDAMLDQGRYPYFLKKRIRGGKGHLSNAKALELFRSLKPAYMSHLLLSHLSKDNNCPDLVHELFSRHAEGVEIVVASRYNETEVYQVSNVPNPYVNRQVSPKEVFVQASLF
ncbi:MBL fold metallo-hydrolase [Flavihumibacter sp. R14]|nr:MBL fold metallo-hydrolase [Flavihumibacter soli]